MKSKFFKLNFSLIFVISFSLNLKTIATDSVSPPDCGTKNAVNFIVNGREAMAYEFPFIVLIKLNGNQLCGGAILNHWWVITAAHCFKGYENHIRGFTLHLGAHTQSEGQVYGLSRIVTHPQFDMDSMNSDITLVRTNRRIEFTNKIRSICLPQVPFREPTGVMTVAGWGRMWNKGSVSAVLMKVSLPIITIQACANMYKDLGIQVFRSNFCTYQPGMDTCEGDSGGPGFQYLNNKATIMGIVSFGWDCADSHPGAYTKVSWFLDWIKQVAQDR